MHPLELRDEFLAKHMRGTAIELRNKQNTGWAQKGPDDLLAITYPVSNVQWARDAVSAATLGKYRVAGELIRHCFKSPENSQFMANVRTRNNGHFEPGTATAVDRIRFVPSIVLGAAHSFSCN